MEIRTLLIVCPYWNGYTIKIKFFKVAPIESVTLYMTYSSSSPLLSSIQDGQIGRLGMSSLEMSKQEWGFCLLYFAFFFKNNLWVVFFPLNIRLSLEHMRFLVFPAKQLGTSLNFAQTLDVQKVSYYLVLSEREVSRPVAVILSPL